MDAILIVIGLVLGASLDEVRQRFRRKEAARDRRFELEARHREWLRDRRVDAYSELLSVTGDLTEKIAEIQAALDDNDSSAAIWRGHGELLNGLEARLRAVVARCDVIGSVSVTPRAHHIHDTTSDIYEALTERDAGALESVSALLTAYLDELATVVYLEIVERK
jgi:hypothetical protein